MGTLIMSGRMTWLLVWLATLSHHQTSAYGPGMIQKELAPSKYPLAMCNDGTQANYYHQPGENHGKFLISFQGGGTCDSVENCDSRFITAVAILGLAPEWPPQKLGATTFTENTYLKL